MAVPWVGQLQTQVVRVRGGFPSLYFPFKKRLFLPGTQLCHFSVKEMGTTLFKGYSFSKSTDCVSGKLCDLRHVPL